MRREEKTTDKRSYRAALFGSQIVDLGIDGFGKWLVDSFCGSEPHPRLGWFHYDDEEYFGSVLADVTPELTVLEKTISQAACRFALDRFDRETGTYEGLFNLARIAESLQLTDALPKIAEVLGAWMTPGGPVCREPSREVDVYLLREILEGAFRGMIRSAARGREEFSKHIRTLAQWASDMMLLGSERRALVPCWAPMFVLAVFIDQCDATGKRQVLEEVLNAGSLLSSDINPSFFVYTYEGQQFPYAIGEILAQVDLWTSWSDTQTSSRYVGDPFKRASATDGLSLEASIEFKKILEPVE